MRPQLRWSTRVHKVRFSVELLNAGEIEPGLVAHHWLAKGCCEMIFRWRALAAQS